MLSPAFLTHPVAAVLAHPGWGQAGAQLAWPHFVAGKDFLLLGVTLIGTTITPYM